MTGNSLPLFSEQNGWLGGSRSQVICEARNYEGPHSWGSCQGCEPTESSCHQCCGSVILSSCSSQQSVFLHHGCALCIECTFKPTTVGEWFFTFKAPHTVTQTQWPKHKQTDVQIMNFNKYLCYFYLELGIHPNYLCIETYHQLHLKLAKIFAKYPFWTLLKSQICTQTLALPKNYINLFENQKLKTTIQIPI